MTDEEIREYLNGTPTISGIVAEMKTWWTNEGTDTILQECFDKIVELSTVPNAEPERGTGRWIIDGHHIRCSCCEFSMCDTDREGDSFSRNFCPNCGAHMFIETIE